MFVTPDPTELKGCKYIYNELKQQKHIKTMANLSIKTQGVKGGNPQYKENIGYATLFLHSEDRISIDVFEGFGDSYKRRETECIEIYENGKLLFSGDRRELFEILKGK